MRTLPLGFRIVLLVLPLALVPLGIVGGVAYAYLDAALRADLEAAQVRTLNEAVRRVAQAVDEALRVTDVLARSPELPALARGPGVGAAARRTVEVSLALSAGLERLRVVDAAGTPLLLVARQASTPDAAALPLVPADLGETGVERRFLDARHGRLVLAAARPLAMAAGRAAWVVADVDAARLLADLSAQIGAGAYAFVDARGRLLASGAQPFPARLAALRPTTASAMRIEDTPDTPPGFDLLAAPAGVFSGVDDGAPRTVFLLHLVAQGEVVERARELRRTAGWLSAAAVAIGLIGAGLIARTVVHPLTALLDMTRRIGEGEFNVALARPRDDEIGQLVNAFNEMAASLAEYKDRLVHAETFAALGRVASTVAHEVRNPLNAMRGCVEFLRMKRGDDDTVRRYCGIMEEEIAALDDFVREFLQVARFERPTLAPVRLQELVHARLDAHRAEADSHGITLQLAIDDACPAVDGDQKQLAIVIDNLLNNAIDAMPAGGVLAVGCEHEPGAVVVKVADTGGGIPSSVAGAIFTPFVSTKPSGTGLGLAICRRIVDAHGGTLTFESREGQGTRFEFRLPAKANPGGDENSAA